MPEGPSLRHWCQLTRQFVGREIIRICGSSKVLDRNEWTGARLTEVEVYGKQLYMHLQKEASSEKETDTTPNCSQSMWLRCHFLMWGSVRANEFNCKPSKTNRFPEPRLVFYFSKDEFLVYYGGSYRVVDGPPEDSNTDILSDTFNLEMAVDGIVQNDDPVCFTLMNQSKFSGLGNIIKNEVVFGAKVHPMRPGSSLPREKAAEIVNHAIAFSRTWLAWKTGKVHHKFGDETRIYKKSKCPFDHPVNKSSFGPLGMKRITYWCPTCQPELCEESRATSSNQDIDMDVPNVKVEITDYNTVTEGYEGSSLLDQTKEDGPSPYHRHEHLGQTTSASQSDSLNEDVPGPEARVTANYPAKRIKQEPDESIIHIPLIKQEVGGYDDQVASSFCDTASQDASKTGDEDRRNVNQDDGTRGDSIRVSIGLSTLSTLMRRRVRVRVSKLSTTRP